MLKQGKSPPCSAPRIPQGVFLVLPIVVHLGVAAIFFPLKWIAMIVLAVLVAKSLIDGIIGLLMLLAGSVCGFLVILLNLLVGALDLGETLARHTLLHLKPRNSSRPSSFPEGV